MIGQTLSHYRITAKLGEGGMGEVYRAEDTTLDREVAIKVLPEAFTADAERLARFEREAKVLASLNHPHIAQIFGFEKVEERRLLIMELAPGETLAERLQGGALPREEAVPIARQIADALESAHEAGVIHRDLKPGNLKIAPDDRVKILDFGLAKALHPGREPGRIEAEISQSPTLTADMTQAGALLGTAAYMSPEQAKGQPADRRADVWAFGVVLWEMLTGRRLFEGETTSEILASVLRQPIDGAALPTETPAMLRGLLTRCLDRDPRSRLRDIGEARIALDTLAGDSGAISLLTGAPTADEPVPATHKSARIAWLMAAAALAAALLVGLLWLGGETDSPELPELVANLLPPTGSTINVDGGLALSTDGRQIAFVVDSESGLQQICVQSLDESVCEPLEGTEGGRYPFWSPDGQHLGFFADSSLQRIDIGGGPPRILAPVVRERGGAWCEGDRIVYAPDSLSGLSMIPAGGGEPTVLTTPDAERGENSHRHPSCLPPGEVILMLAQTGEGGSRNDESRVDWVSLATGERRALVQVNSSAAFAPSGHLLYWQEGTLLAAPMDLTEPGLTGEPRPVAHDVDYTDNENALFSVSTTGLLAYIKDNPTKFHSRFQRVDLSGSPISEPSPADHHDNMAVSHGGTQAAYEAADYSSLWIRDLERGTTSRLTLQDGDHWGAVWSPQDDWIVFATDRQGQFQIYRQRPAGVESEELLLESESEQWWPEDFLPTGDLLSLTAMERDGDTHIAMLDTEDGGLEILVDSAFRELDGHFSPDGRWLAYVSDETGERQVYVMPLDGRTGKYQLSADGGEYPRWSPDGDRVYYLSPTRDLMAVDITLGEPVRIGVARPLFRIDRPASGDPYAVHPDGTSFILNQRDIPRIPDHITLVQKWTSRLR